MSRSHRHNPVGGFTTARSEEEDKRLANRTLHACVWAQFATHGDEHPLPTMREVSDPWSPVTFDVRSGDEKLGTLKVGRGSIAWTPAKGQIPDESICPAFAERIHRLCGRE